MPNHRVLLTCLLAVCMAPYAIAGLIPNGSFENQPNTTWTTFSVSPLTGTFTTEWSSDGQWGYRFMRPGGFVGGGAYASISRVLKLTGVTGFLFDAQDQGIDMHETIQFLIDGVLVGQWGNNGHPGGAGGYYAPWGGITQTYNISIPLSSAYSGMRTLMIRHYVPFSYGPADPKIYWIDNIRAVGGVAEAVIPEPASWALLALGLAGLDAIRRRR